MNIWTIYIWITDINDNITEHSLDIDLSLLSDNKSINDHIRNTFSGSSMKSLRWKFAEGQRDADYDEFYADI